MSQADAGELDDAIELMEQALEQSPNNVEIKLNLAKLLAEHGQGELGIGHCDELLELNPRNIQARQARSTCLQYLGRFDESLAEYKQCLSGTVDRTAMQRNNLAYFRALANKELDKAAIDIQKAIQEEESEYWGCRYLVPIQVRTAVVASLVSRHIDRQEEVLPLLNAKIAQYMHARATEDQRTKARIVQEMRIQIPFNEATEKELLFSRGNLELTKNCLGIMLATRALIFEDLCRHVESDFDRKFIEDLGFDLDQLLRDLPSDEACLAALDKANVLLDTRGFVAGRREWQGEISRSLQFVSDSVAPAGPLSFTRPSSYQEALEDMNLAVLSARFSQLALDSPLYNTPEISARQIVVMKRRANKMTAVLLYHRMKVHTRGGNRCAANDDQRRIEQLGMQPDSSLF